MEEIYRGFNILSGGFKLAFRLDKERRKNFTDRLEEAIVWEPPLNS